MSQVKLTKYAINGLSINMPEGSDALMEVAGTYEEIIDEISSDQDDNPICDYDFLDKTAYGFTFQTEDDCLCNSFLCVAMGSDVELETGAGCKLMTILTTAKTYEDIDDLLDLIEQNISCE